jgi:hypothetical protein
MKLTRYIIALAVAVLLAAPPTSAMANPGLQVSNMLLIANVSSGDVLTSTMKVSIGATDPMVEIGVQVTGLVQSIDGTNGPSDSAQDTSPYSARSFISVDKTSFQLQPGASQDVTATISVPKDVGAGGRYAIIHITTLAAPGSGVNIITAVDVPVVLTITGSQLVHTGKITSINIGQPVSGQPINILTTFQNTGNHHFKVKGEVTVSDPQGKVLDTIIMPLGFSSIVPTMSVQSKSAFIPRVTLSPGVYSVQSRVTADDGTVLDTSAGSFTVGASGIAPVTSQSTTAISKPQTSVKVPTTQTPGAPMATLPPPKPPVNWMFIGGIIAGLIVIALFVFFALKRKVQS